MERLARGKAWTRSRAQSGGAFLVLGVHALDLSRWLAGARGEPLENLMATSSGLTPLADFPLVGSVSGTLRGTATIDAVVDLTGDQPFHLHVEVEAVNGHFTLPTCANWPGPPPEDPASHDVEYEGLMQHFVDAVRSGEVDPTYVAECLQTHRDLLAADDLTRTCGPQSFNGPSP
jgi:predicted dehydrogenase